MSLTTGQNKFRCV